MEKHQEHRDGWRVMEERYHGHYISGRGTKNFVDNTWNPQVTILWEENGIPRVQPFTLEQGFSHEDEAAKLGLIFARGWIDRGKPAPTSLHAW